jgi:hypothetical protein
MARLNRFLGAFDYPEPQDCDDSDSNTAFIGSETAAIDTDRDILICPR